MRVLVCGAKDWDDPKLLEKLLMQLHAKHEITLLIEGEAAGADTQSRDWAEANGLPVEKVPANWDRYGKAAGPIRNRQMLRKHPDVVLGFHHDITQSKGTRDMIDIAQKGGFVNFVLPRDLRLYWAWLDS